MKKIYLFGILVVIFSFALFFTNCDKKVGTVALTNVPPPPPGACDTITYTKHIAPIMASGCGSGSSGCHGAGSPMPKLTNYAEVKLKGETGRIKARAIDGNPSIMPAIGKLPQAQLDLITCWLNNGYKQ